MKKGKGYCSVKVGELPGLEYESLKEIGKRFGEDIRVIKPEDRHITLMYDRRNKPELDDIVAKHPMHHEYYLLHPFKKEDFVVLGTGYWRALVVKVNSKRLHDRHEQLVRLGFEHSYPEFTPHISLMYSENLPEELPDGVLKDLMGVYKLYPPRIISSKEYWEEIEE